MDIKHNAEQRRFEIEVDGYTIVPSEIGGRGIASALVKAAYDFALENALKPIATCSYAVVWLQRHPEYQGEISKDYCEGNSCAL